MTAQAACSGQWGLVAPGGGFAAPWVSPLVSCRGGVCSGTAGCRRSPRGAELLPQQHPKIQPRDGCPTVLVTAQSQMEASSSLSSLLPLLFT